MATPRLSLLASSSGPASALWCSPSPKTHSGSRSVLGLESWSGLYFRRTGGRGVLEIRELHKRYGEVVALDGAAFVVSPGRILGFLGPNGAGKTTTMRVVFGLVDPDAGDVTWSGNTITDADRRRFGYMPEERGLYPKMEVRDQVVHFGRLSGMGSQSAVAATDRWLGLLGIDDRAESKVEELSHGNQQRVQLAAALVHDPVVLVLDEPFAGLDPLGVDALSATLQDLADNGTAIMFSSHQLDLVEDVSQDVAIIDRGRVVLSGVLDDLKAASTTRRPRRRGQRGSLGTRFRRPRRHRRSRSTPYPRRQRCARG